MFDLGPAYWAFQFDFYGAVFTQANMAAWQTNDLKCGRVKTWMIPHWLKTPQLVPTSFGLLTQTTHFCSCVKCTGFDLDRERRSCRDRSSVSFNNRSARSCFLRRYILRKIYAVSRDAIAPQNIALVIIPVFASSNLRNNELFVAVVKNIGPTSDACNRKLLPSTSNSPTAVTKLPSRKISSVVWNPRCRTPEKKPNRWSKNDNADGS